MAANAGNAWTLTTGIQSAINTPNSTGHMKQRYTGGFGPRPNRDIIELAETDAFRQTGARVVVGVRVEGSSEHYLRYEEFHRDAHLLMGQTSSTGATNYTHTATSTSSGSAPYATLFRALNSTVLVDRFVDCQISSMSISGSAGQAITYSKDWVGLTPTAGATDTALAQPTTTPATYPEVTVTKNSVTTDVISAFTLNITQNRTLLLGDTGLSGAAIVPGAIAVTGSMTILFESDADWRAFQTGTTSGTTYGTTIYTQPLTVLIQRDVNTSVSFTIANFEMTAYDPPGNTDGSPMQVSVDFSSQRSNTLSNLMSIVTKNQIATVTT